MAATDGNGGSTRGGPRFNSLRAPAAGGTDVVRPARRGRTNRPPDAGTTAKTDPAPPVASSAPPEPISETMPAAPIGIDPLPRISSLDDEGSSPLTTLLAEPLPSNPPLGPGAETEAQGQSGIVARAEPAPPTEAPASTTPAPASAPAASTRSRDRIYRFAQVGVIGIAFGAAAAWAFGYDGDAGVDPTSMPAPPPPTPGEGEPPAHAAPVVAELEPELEPEPSIDAVAILPAPTAEVLGENTWVRRIRAAEMRGQARQSYLAGHWRIAQQGFRESLAWDPTNVDAMRNVSRAHQRLGEMDQALAWARRALVTDDRDARNHELLGDQLLMMGHVDEAAAAYRTGIAVVPSDIRLRSRLRRIELGVPTAPAP